MSEFIDPRRQRVARQNVVRREPTDHFKPLTELHQLCRAGRLYDVERWIQAGRPIQVHPSAIPHRGRTSSALEIALKAGNHDLILLLLANGYDPNLEPRCLLSVAIRGRRWDLLELLLEFRANPRRVDLSDVFDSYNSALWDRLSALGVDLAAGYELASALGYHTSNKPLFGWVKRHREDDPRIQKALNMALIHHTSEGNEKGVQLCLWAGADPHTPAPDLRWPDLVDDEDPDCEPNDCYLGSTAIYEACSQGNAKLLQRLGPDPAVDDFDDLYQAAADGQVIEFLATLKSPSNVGMIVSRQALWMQERPVGHPRSSDVLRRLFQVGARWTTSTPDEIASVRRSLLRMSPFNFEEAMKLLASRDYCSSEILRALGRTDTIRARMRKVGFLSSPEETQRDNAYRPTRSREVVSKFGVEPKKRAGKEEAPLISRSVLIGIWRPNVRRIVLDRQALFERVWSQPVESLAKEWGLSDRGLAKACARLQIPVPPRGYWAKVRQGRTPGRPRLPAVKPHEAEEIIVIVPGPSIEPAG